MVNIFQNQLTIFIKLIFGRIYLRERQTRLKTVFMIFKYDKSWGSSDTFCFVIKMKIFRDIFHLRINCSYLMVSQFLVRIGYIFFRQLVIFFCRCSINIAGFICKYKNIWWWFDSEISAYFWKSLFNFLDFKEVITMNKSFSKWSNSFNFFKWSFDLNPNISYFASSFCFPLLPR